MASIRIETSYLLTVTFNPGDTAYPWCVTSIRNRGGSLFSSADLAIQHLQARHEMTYDDAEQLVSDAILPFIVVGHFRTV